jgi:uncharacterized protein YbaR (Trm112 family)
MNIESIFSFLKREKGKSEAPEGFCPNCWGQQEYSGKFYEAIKNEGVDINSLNPKKGWIQDYAEKNLNTIILQHREDESLVCPRCKLVYKENG